MPVVASNRAMKEGLPFLDVVSITILNVAAFRSDFTLVNIARYRRKLHRFGEERCRSILLNKLKIFTKTF